MKSFSTIRKAGTLLAATAAAAMLLVGCGSAASTGSAASSSNSTGSSVSTSASSTASSTQSTSTDAAQTVADANTEDADGTESTEASGSGKTLVVYYSATGDTKRDAEEIAKVTGADLFEITPAEPYTQDDLNWSNPDSRVSKEHEDESLRDVPLSTTEVPDWDSYGAVSRKDLFLTTKVWLQDYGDGKTTQSVERSLKKMGMDYLDLVLLHQPFGNWQAAWRELEELSRSGLVRAIGVSNFTEKKLEELLDMAQIIPAVNQIERHPFYTEDRYIARMKRMGVQAESWGALCEGLKGIFHNPVLTRIGEKYGKSAAQVAIRWNIQTGCIALVKSVRPEKMKEDIEVFDFALTQDEIREIASLDAGHSEIIDLENPVTERLLLKAKLLA